MSDNLNIWNNYNNIILENMTEKKSFHKHLQIGIDIEMKYTDDPKIAEKIVRDRLAKDPQYYIKLKAAQP